MFLTAFIIGDGGAGSRCTRGGKEERTRECEPRGGCGCGK